MKRFMSVFVLFVMIISLCACSSEPMIDEGTQNENETDGAVVGDAPENELSVDTYEPGELPVTDGTEFYFSSGAGAWYTCLILNKDGSFEGEYSDTEAGDPQGPSVYYSAFSGKFTDIEKINDYSYRMTLSELTLENEPGEEWTEYGHRFVASDPYGVAGGKEFILYLPETPAVTVEGDFLTWWPQRYEQIDEFGNFTGDPETTLSCYGIHNITGGYGFYTHE